MHTQHINFHLISTLLILLKIDENCSRGFLKCSGRYTKKRQEIQERVTVDQVLQPIRILRASHSITTPSKTLLRNFDMERRLKDHFE